MWRKKETCGIKIKYSTSEISDRLIVSPSDKYSSAVSSNMKRLNTDILQDKGFLLSVAAASGSVASSSAGLIMEQIYFDSGSNVPWSINSLSFFSVLPSKRYRTGRHKEPLDASLFSGAVWLCDYHNGEKGRRGGGIEGRDSAGWDGVQSGPVASNFVCVILNWGVRDCSWGDLYVGTGSHGSKAIVQNSPLNFSDTQPLSQNQSEW